MKIVVLTPGRTGSLSLFRACQTIENYTVSHDSQAGSLAAERSRLQANHIHIDTRYPWMLGVLASQEDSDTAYVHLKRSSEKVAASYNRRWYNRKGIMRGYCEGILQRDKSTSDLDVARDMIATANLNIETFLDGRRFWSINMDEPSEDARIFLKAICAQVDVERFMSVLSKPSNTSSKAPIFFALRLRLSLLTDRLENFLRRLRKRA